MTASFTIVEIFEIAEQIEHNGAKFYRLAAEKTKDKSARKFFLQFAEMEDGHEKTFADMRKNLQTDDVNVFDPDNEVIYYLHIMAENAGWEGKAAPKVEFSGNETSAQVIKIALAAERASIDYYIGIRELVQSQTGKSKIDEIIREEMGHVVTLQKQLK